MKATRPTPTPNTRAVETAKKAAKANNELLQKGIFLAFIGLAVLIGPMFMAPSGMRDMVASSSMVGWFALVLGGAFVVLYGVRRRALTRS